MRNIAIALAATFALAACGQSSAPPPLPEPEAPVTTPPWFICDAIDAPVLLLFERANGVAHVAQYSKPDGAIVGRSQYTIGEPEGAAGSVMTPLMQNGADAGVIRQLNPGMLETPGAAYTAPVRSVRLGDREIDCRWMPRTRIFGFTGRRSFVIHEDQSGDLIYTAYDFTAASAAEPIELSENARTTTFTAEIRGGAESTTPEGAALRFEGQDGFTYIVTIAPNRAGTLAVEHNGAQVQSEPLVNFQEGAADAG